MSVQPSQSFPDNLAQLARAESGAYIYDNGQGLVACGGIRKAIEYIKGAIFNGAFGIYDRTSSRVIGDRLVTILKQNEQTITREQLTIIGQIAKRAYALGNVHEDQDHEILKLNLANRVTKFAQKLSAVELQEADPVARPTGASNTPVASMQTADVETQELPSTEELEEPVQTWGLTTTKVMVLVGSAALAAVGAVVAGKYLLGENGVEEVKPFIGPSENPNGVCVAPWTNVTQLQKQPIVPEFKPFVEPPDNSNWTCAASWTNATQLPQPLILKSKRFEANELVGLNITAKVAAPPTEPNSVNTTGTLALNDDAIDPDKRQFLTQVSDLLCHAWDPQAQSTWHEWLNAIYDNSTPEEISVFLAGLTLTALNIGQGALRAEGTREQKLARSLLTMGSVIGAVLGMYQNMLSAPSLGGKPNRAVVKQLGLTLLPLINNLKQLEIGTWATGMPVVLMLAVLFHQQGARVKEFGLNSASMLTKNAVAMAMDGAKKVPLLANERAKEALALIFGLESAFDSSGHFLMHSVANQANMTALAYLQQGNYNKLTMAAATGMALANGIFMYNTAAYYHTVAEAVAGAGMGALLNLGGLAAWSLGNRVYATMQNKSAA